MFIHSVYFWLRDDLRADELARFHAGVRSLAGIETVKHSRLGGPAPTRRPVIDSSYSYALVAEFDDQAGHDAYQAHPVHDVFRADCGTFWTRVQIYDIGA